MSEAEVEAQAASGGTLEVFRTFYDPDLDFRKLAAELTGVARGFRLVEKDDLLNVPHIIISVTWRPGYLRQQESGPAIKGDYVSLEAVVADAEMLRSPQVRAHIDVGNLAVYPNEAVIYNDGGTGIRRSCTRMFDEVGMIDVGGTEKDDRRWDRPFSMWAAGAELAQEGIRTTRSGKALAYGVPRGLRKSVYQNPAAAEGIDSETFYFA